MAKKPRTVDIFIDSRIGTAGRRAIAEEAIRYIQERTDEGNGVDNKPFKQTSEFKGNRKSQRSYSKNYIDHVDFKTAGKSQSPINLRLTGDMIDSIEVVDISIPGRVRIGYKDNSDESEKADFNAEKGYDFLKLSNKEVDSIVERIATQSIEESESFGIAEQLANEILGNINEN